MDGRRFHKMALQKSITLPGGYVANYFRIDRICWIDQRMREAKVIVGLYADAAHADQPVKQEAAIVYFRYAAFDAYFTRAAMAASTNVYAITYDVIVAATAAFVAKRDGAQLTDAQKVLTTMGNVDIYSDFGNSLAFEGATAA